MGLWTTNHSSYRVMIQSLCWLKPAMMKKEYIVQGGRQYCSVSVNKPVLTSLSFHQNSTKQGL